MAVLSRSFLDTRHFKCPWCGRDAEWNQVQFCHHLIHGHNCTQAWAEVLLKTMGWTPIIHQLSFAQEIRKKITSIQRIIRFDGYRPSLGKKHDDLLKEEWQWNLHP